MSKSQRDVAKEAYWRKVVKQFSGSGLTVREFCKREQLTESAFYAWRRTIGERDNANGGSREAPAFVPAVVTEEPRHEGSIALELIGGEVLRFVGPSATEYLADLIVALQARAAR